MQKFGKKTNYRRNEEMKFIQLLFVCLFFIACDSFSNWWNDCPTDRDKEYIRIFAYTDIDTVISDEDFYHNEHYDPKYGRFATKFKDLGSDSISVSIIGKGDTLNYALEIKNQENIIILVDSSNAPCASDSILSKRGHDLYRVDADKIHSCVFYLYQSCD